MLWYFSALLPQWLFCYAATVKVIRIAYRCSCFPTNAKMHWVHVQSADNMQKSQVAVWRIAARDQLTFSMCRRWGMKSLPLCTMPCCLLESACITYRSLRHLGRWQVPDSCEVAAGVWQLKSLPCKTVFQCCCAERKLYVWFVLTWNTLPHGSRPWNHWMPCNLLSVTFRTWKALEFVKFLKIRCS